MEGSTTRECTVHGAHVWACTNCTVPAYPACINATVRVPGLAVALLSLGHRMPGLLPSRPPAAGPRRMSSARAEGGRQRAAR